MVTILAVASRAVLEGCERLGIPSAELLAQAQLTPEALADPDARLESHQAEALWRAAYQRSRDPLLALHAAEHLSFGAYRVVDFLVANSATVGEGIERLARYFAIIDPRGTLELRRGAAFELAMSAGAGAELPGPAQEYTFAVIANRLRALCGETLRPQLVELTIPSPPDPGEHQRVFGAPVRFGQPDARMLFSARAWATPIQHAHAELLGILEDYARERLKAATPPATLSEKVRQALVSSLAEGKPQLEPIAKRLALSSRTLQRQLLTEHTTFAKLVDEVRYSLARGYLKSENVSLAEIAFLLGFADQAAFTHAFRRWTGTTPRAFREHP